VVADEHDKRNRLVALTEAGWAKIAQSRPSRISHACSSRIFSSSSSEWNLACYAADIARGLI
jgi:DNA-binding MarR family transcriptional regulator